MACGSSEPLAGRRTTPATALGLENSRGLSGGNVRSAILHAEALIHGGVQFRVGFLTGELTGAAGTVGPPDGRQGGHLLDFVDFVDFVTLHRNCSEIDAGKWVIDACGPLEASKDPSPCRQRDNLASST